MSLKSILSEEVSRISLSKDDIMHFERVAKDFISSLKEKGISAYIGGSLAKGTMVSRKGRQDVDIFVVFDYSEDILGFDKVLEKIKLPGELKTVHGSRDYFQIICEDVVLEVIPVVKNSDPETAENVTDISLSHVRYVGGILKKNPEIADEIKLAKAFCRAQKCYGAEGYIKGFSGYSLEVLVIHFGSFVKFLKGVGKKRVIDPVKHFRNEREVLSEINASKLDGPLVVVDPTYKYRNVSAGLGEETYQRFLKVASGFLKNPSLSFFDSKPIDVSNMKSFAKSKGARFIEVSLKTDRQEGDIAGTKMKKVFDFLSDELIRNQQEVLMKEFEYSGGQKSKGYLVVLEKKQIEVRGPSIGLEDACEAFRRARGESVFRKGKFLWSKERVSVEGVFDLVRKISKEMGASVKLV
jgi:tRNA CCA-adding enzyme